MTDILGRHDLRERAPRGARQRPCVWCKKKICVDDCDRCGQLYECFLAREEDWARLPRKWRRKSLCATCFSEETGLARPSVVSGRSATSNRRIGGGHTFAGSTVRGARGARGRST